MAHSVNVAALIGRPVRAAPSPFHGFPPWTAMDSSGASPAQNGSGGRPTGPTALVESGREKITEESNRSGAVSLSNGAPRVLAFDGPSTAAMIANLHCGAAGIAALPVLRRTAPEAKSAVLAAETTKSFHWHRPARSVCKVSGKKQEAFFDRPTIHDREPHPGIQDTL
jgi:hypothetical protein